MRQPVFNELTQRCDNPNEVPPPCGTFNEDSVCASRINGIYPARSVKIISRQSPFIPISPNHLQMFILFLKVQLVRFEIFL